MDRLQLGTYRHDGADRQELGVQGVVVAARPRTYGESVGHTVREIASDPWEWCKPPERVEDMAEYAPLSWWYGVLNPRVPWTAFASMSSRPLKEAYREVTQTRLSEWSSRLRTACDQYKADRALADALRADMNPEYQHWVVEDAGLRLASSGGRRHRVGNPGLHGRSADEIGLAYALSHAELPLPMIEEARLAYAQPHVVPVHDLVSDPIEPWNGDTFEGVEWVEWSDHRRGLDRPDYLQIENRVTYYWDGVSCCRFRGHEDKIVTMELESGYDETEVQP